MITSARFILAILVLASLGCEKVPIRESHAQFDSSSSHWFENEKTQYVFFSVAGLRTGQAKLSWPSQFEMALDKGQFQNLDLSTGVFHHQLVECSPGRLCGSYSFHADKPVQNISLRFKYTSAGSMSESTTIPTAEHPANQGAASQSALFYGVFNSDNSRVQIRVHDNFGTPDSNQIKQFGMTRDFSIENEALTDLTADDEANIAATSGSALLFPADRCTDFLPASASASAFAFSGDQAWTQTKYDSEDARATACFRAKLLGRKGEVENAAIGVARRNPVLTGAPLTIQPPLQAAQKVPITIGYCQGLPESDQLTSALFLRYQEFILGISQNPSFDVCFTIEDEEKFGSALDQVIKGKLIAARSANPTADLFLAVVINHRLAPQITFFHQVIADHLASIIASESALISPRLVGAFVYDSQAPKGLTSKSNPQITWCPREEKKKKGPSAPADDKNYDADANCTPRKAGTFEFGPFNFLIPMGPFPTLDTFVDYTQKYGDRGETNNPKLELQAVRTTATSVSDSSTSSLYTFFDNQRISLRVGENLRFCRERDTNGLLNDLVFRKDQGRGKSPIYDIDSIPDALKAGNQTRGGSPTIFVGLHWHSPFIGKFSFESPVEGKVFGVIPVSATLGKSQAIGDALWSKGQWSLSTLAQKCLKFCYHPVFDEAGQYQTSETWNDRSTCVEPKMTEPTN